MKRLPPFPLAKQGRNNHCGPIALCVAECIMRCKIPPSQKAVDAVEQTTLKTRGTIEGANQFWAAYRRRVACAIATGVLPPDIAAFEQRQLTALTATSRKS